MHTQTRNIHSTMATPPCVFSGIKYNEFGKTQLTRLADTLTRSDKFIEVMDVDETDGKFQLIGRDFAYEKDEPRSKTAMVVVATVMISTFLMTMSAMSATRTDTTTMADSFKTSVTAQAPADLGQLASLSIKRQPKVQLVINRGLMTEFVVACYPGEGVISRSRIDRTFCTPDASCFTRIRTAIKNLCK